MDYVLGLRARERCISYNCTRNAEVPRLLVGDPTRLRQIMLTLISNALKFSHQGEASVHVDLEKELENKIALRFTLKEKGKDSKAGEWRRKTLEALGPFKPVENRENFQCPHWAGPWPDHRQAIGGSHGRRNRSGNDSRRRTESLVYCGFRKAGS